MKILSEKEVQELYMLTELIKGSNETIQVVTDDIFESDNKVDKVNAETLDKAHGHINNYVFHMRQILK